MDPTQHTASISLLDTKTYWVDVVSNHIDGLEELEWASSQLVDMVSRLRSKDLHTDLNEIIGCLDITLQRATAVIRKLSNGSRPINRLPAEIVLQHIFSLVPKRHSCTEEDTQIHWPFGPLSFAHLEVITQVCKHWHDLVARAPTLWSRYRHTPRGIAKPPASFAMRSPTALIDIYSLNTPFQKHLGKLVRDESHRIRQIHLRRIRIADSDVLLSTLRTLDLESLKHCSIELPPLMDQDLHAPLLTVSTASRLRSLLVQSLSILPTQKFHSLTRLVLSSHHTPYDDSDTDSGWDVLHLLKLLAGAPKLEVLHLCRVRTCGGTESRLPRVVLNHLRYLSYDTPTMDVPSLTALLSNINIPANCRVYTDYILVSVTSSAEISSLIHSLPGNMSLYKRATIHFRYQAARVELPTITSDQNGRGGGACIVFRIEHHDDSFRDLISSLDFLEHSEEVRINIDGYEERSAERAVWIVSSLVNVRRLALSFKWSFSPEYRYSFGTVLRPLHQYESVTKPTCPNLQDLDIYVVRSIDEMAWNIADMLAVRAAHNKPIRRLVLYTIDSAHGFDLSRHVTEYALEKFASLSTSWDEWPDVPDDLRTRTADGDGGVSRDGVEPIGWDWTTW